ncbi:hypothetical protein JCM3765_004349 [Sporobolomyces pararoseus]
MSKDWTQLKAKRANRTQGGPAPSSSSSSPPSPSPSSESRPPSTTLNGAAGLSNRVDYSHSDLPSSLSVRSIPARGRGILAESSFTPGSTLLSTTPVVSVLDNRNISQRCSACYRLSEDTVAQKPLQQCSLCHIVQYCSPTCQNQDWKLHKFECKAMRNMSSLAKEKGKGKGKSPYVPDTPVRAIGRLLWRSEAEGKSFRKQVDTLESRKAFCLNRYSQQMTDTSCFADREKLTAEEQERFFHLSVAVSTYVGQSTVLNSCDTPAALMDLLSRFTSNSFSLTSPTDLTNIGVSISPLTALFNHSCRPNAVVVFPSFPSPPPSISSASSSPSTSTSKNMRVVAIRDIREGEEVLTSYVDLASPRELRRNELRERYKFECSCAECEKTGVDAREAFACPGTNCNGFLGIIDGGGKSTCSKCNEVFEVPDIDSALQAAKSAFIEAEKTQYSDPAASLINLSNLISSLTTSFVPPLAPSAYPLFQSYSLLLTLQLHSQEFSSAAQTALSAWKGASNLYPYGHPVRSILSTTIAQLASIPPVNPSPEKDLKYWSNLKDRTNGLKMMVEALKECEIGFGKKEGGGQVGKKLRALIRDQEEGIEMGRKLMREMQ